MTWASGTLLVPKKTSVEPQTNPVPLMSMSGAMVGSVLSEAAGVFVTGTGTEVGKTVVAAVIARTHAAAGETVAVFKPAVSGLDEAGEPDHALLRRAAGSEQPDDEIAPYRYRAPVSPHLGAELAGERIDPARLRAAALAAVSRGALLRRACRRKRRVLRSAGHIASASSLNAAGRRSGGGTSVASS